MKWLEIIFGQQINFHRHAGSVYYKFIDKNRQEYLEGDLDLNKQLMC